MIHGSLIEFFLNFSVLKLVNEAPKAICVECEESDRNHRIPSCDSSTGDDSSDQSLQSSSSSTNIHQNHHLIDKPLNGHGIHNSSLGLMNSGSDNELILMSLPIASSSPIYANSDSLQCSSNPSPNPPIIEDSEEFENPFGKAFHGYLTHSQCKKRLVKDGQFLVRRRAGARDNVLTFRFGFFWYTFWAKLG